MNIQGDIIPRKRVKFKIVLKYEFLEKIQALCLSRYDLYMIRAYGMSYFGIII